MKASLKFREDRNPLIRAKVPLNILGLPFQSSLIAGDSKELTLNLGTFFESGPSFRISYRPNDSWNPFSLILKTGTGRYGSPISSSLSMTAEFSLVNRGTSSSNPNPRFMLHFMPNFGDFSIKKTQSSNVLDSKVTLKPDEDSSIEVVERPAAAAVGNGGGHSFAENVAFFGKKVAVPTPDSTAGIIAGMLSGIEVAARTAVPVRGRTVVSFRWGVRVPVEMESGISSVNGFRLNKIPFLVMNKIGIEHVEKSETESKEVVEKGGSLSSDLKFAAGGDVVEVCFAVKRQLEVLQSENAMLKRSIEDMRQEFAGKKLSSGVSGFDSGKYREVDRNGNRSSSVKVDRRSNEKKFDSGGFGGKSGDGDVGEELKKALMGATGA